MSHPHRSLVRSLPALTVLIAGLAVSGPVSPVDAQEQPRKVVKTADDLPRHTYKIDGKASEFVESAEKISVLMAQVRTNLETTLAAYDIQDPTTLQGYLGTLQTIALLEGRNEDALGYIDRIRDLEVKESQKLVTGFVQRAIVASRSAPAGKETDALKADLDSRLRALPFDKIREIVSQRKSQLEIITAELVRGQLQAQLDPVVASTNGEVSDDIARQMIQIAFTLREVLPRREAMGSVYAKLLSDNTGEAKDIWAERGVTLKDEGLTPVVVGVWDSGVDTAIFPKQLWTNTKEQANGKDDDGNGFVDDVHGIAFDLDSRPSAALLFPIGGMKTPLETVQKYASGISDLQANIDSKEAGEARDFFRSLKREEVGPFMEDLGQWGSYMHGTHVAGISVDGNPAARVLVARLEFDYRNIPLHAPTLERSRADAEAAQKTVDYFKANGVRVVNMSWGGSRQDVEDALERKGVGGSAQERAEMAREFFAVYRAGLDAAIKSAPEILFVAAAGNSNNDSQFSEMIPSGLTAPNLITIGAVDQSGKPTGFTTFGRNVSLYASGYQVESYVPGGKREKSSGTSMAAPQVTNLAAKLLAVSPSLSVQDVVRIMTETADPMPGDNPGRLLINPKAAVAAAKQRAERKW